MQAELQGWDVVPGHARCAHRQGRLELTSKIGSEEKAGDRLGLMCPLSVALGLAIWLPRPANRHLSDSTAISYRDSHTA